MRVAEIDVHDDEKVRQWWQVARDADAYGREEYAAFWSLQSTLGAFRDPDNPYQQSPLAAWEGEQLIGVSHLAYPMLDNTHLGILVVMVHPDHRRRGAGTALLHESIEHGRERGRTTFVSEANMPFQDPQTSPGSMFLAKHGFARATLEIHRLLELPAAMSHLDDLGTQAASHARDYRFVSFGDRVPDDILEGYCALQIAFNSEAPLGDLDIEPEVWDEARVRGSEERFEKQGRHQRRTVALAPDGTVVALTEMAASDQQPQLGWQGGTLVLAQHRGHRLGLATKIANLRRYAADFPAVRKVHSWNAEENGPMVAINDALGFRPVEYLAEMQLKVRA